MFGAKFLLQPRKIHSLLATFFLISPVQLLTEISSFGTVFGLRLTDTAGNLAPPLLFRRRSASGQM